MMSYEIPLSVIRECYLENSFTIEDAREIVSRLMDNTTVFGCLQARDKDLLNWAYDNGDAQVAYGADEIDWAIATVADKGVAWRTYRLHPDCVVVDTAEKPAGRWIEREVGVAHSGHYFVIGTPTDRWRICKAGDHRDFVCVRATDEDGETFYMPSFTPFGSGYRSIEDLMLRRMWKTPKGRLTPTHVIFEGGK